jgi:TRAP transporter TAXI family solute receptor
MASFVLRIFVGLVLLAFAPAGRVEAASAKSSGSGEATLRLIGGEDAGTESALAGEMTKLFASEPALNILPLKGDAGLGNLARLITEPAIDVAFVSTDALAEAAEREFGASLPAKVVLVARLGPQEVHVLARRDITSLADLAGQKVNFGPIGASSAATAEYLFKALAIKVKPEALDTSAALAGLKRGDIAALVIIGGKPVPLIADIPAGLGLHLLPIPFATALQERYLPTHFGHDDYPNLIEREAEVPALATGMVLLAAPRQNDKDARARLDRFITTLFSRFAELEGRGHHPKWREVNLAATLPGWERAPAAQAWLAQPCKDDPPAATDGDVVRTGVEANAAGVPPLPMSKDQREALFKGFMEWQRAKGH